MTTNRSNAVVFLFLAALSTIAPTAYGADKKQIQEQTNRAYYNLKNHGLAEFSCDVLSDWDAAFRAMKLDPGFRESGLPIVKQMKFRVSVGPSGAASVSHQFGQAPPSEAIADRLRQVSEGFDQILGGFFETWSQLMMNEPLRGNADDYQMEEKPDGYRITAQSDKTSAVITMRRDLVIDSIEAKTPDVEGIVHPKFKQHDGELILDSFDGEYKLNSTVSQHLSVTIQYQTVDGLLLPRTIRMSMTLPQGQLDLPMTLDSCQVKKQ